MSSRTERATGITSASNNPTKQEIDDIVPVPKYESEQYLPKYEHITGTRKELLLDEFGYVRTFFKTRPANHFNLQRKLNQARMGTTYDLYLTRTVWIALGVGLVWALIGLGIGVLFLQMGVFDGLGMPTVVLSVPVLGQLIVAMAPYKAIFGAAILTVVTGTLFSVFTWFIRYYYPYNVADARRRNINITLPHVIVYMYALSFGGMQFTEVIRRTAETEDTYGEVANEFDMIVRDMELFGNDLYTALRNARNLTPSTHMEQFLDDLLSVLDSGSNFTEFLRTESEKYMNEAVREQESFLDTLELLSEIFIIGFVAAPLFIVVTLLMMSFLGGNTLPILLILVYLIIPLGMLGFLVLVATLSDPYQQPEHKIDLDVDVDRMELSEELQQNPGFEIFQGIQLRERIKGVVKNPVRTFKLEPLYTLVISVPLTIIVWAYLWVTMGASVEGLLFEPYRFGSALLVLPFLLVSVPLAIFYEYDKQRRKHVSKRLPDTLDILASANQMGVSLVEGLEMVSRNITGSFAEELKLTRNDIRWNVDVRQSLLALGHRVKVPQLTRTCHILAEGARSSGELYKILTIAAEDTRQRYRLERNQRQELNSYTVVVIIGFLVYMGVIVIIDYSFLGVLTETIDADGAATQADFLNIDLTELAIYHALFLHSALVMAVGTGLISGKLTDNNILSGLKYAIGLVLLTMFVFAFL